MYLDDGTGESRVWCWGLATGGVQIRWAFLSFRFVLADLIVRAASMNQEIHRRHTRRVPAAYLQQWPGDGRHLPGWGPFPSIYTGQRPTAQSGHGPDWASANRLVTYVSCRKCPSLHSPPFSRIRRAVGWRILRRLLATGALLLGLVAVACREPNGPLLDRDRAALESLYATTQGPAWQRQTNWMQGSRRWYGVTTNALGQVTRLDLSDNGLQGFLPTLGWEGQLAALEVLNLSGNRLKGLSLWVPWHQLAALRVLDLSDNQFQDIPLEKWDSLPSLEVLDLSGNQLQGHVPLQLAALPRLQILDLGKGPWKGCLPSVWARRAVEIRGPALKFCEGTDDRAVLEAVIDTTRGYRGWSSLLCSDEAPSTRCWGNPDLPLGYWQGITTNAAGRVIRLELGNFDHPPGPNLEGPIPPALGQLTALEVLNLAGNGLSGPIPVELGQLPALKSLILWGNQVTGPVPLILAQLPALERLDLFSNRLTGTIPPELGQLPALERLDLTSNRLTGTIPPELGQLPALRVLHLGNNQLMGTIPVELGQLSALKSLFLAGNQLNGAVPPILGQLTTLEMLDLSSNLLMGPIPSEFGQLPALETLVLSSNLLWGPIPPELGQLSTLRFLHLEDNRLEGSIPLDLGQLSALERLDLSHNRLTGPIPATFERLKVLSELNLSSNQLSGAVPRSLGLLPRLSYLLIQDNQLTGCLPLSRTWSENRIEVTASRNAEGELPYCGIRPEVMGS